MSQPDLCYQSLVDGIQQLHTQLLAETTKAVNISLTVRNWSIGCYIAEYELHGADRANYGEALLANLAESLLPLGIKACGRRQLYRYLRFYRAYPQIVRTVSTQFGDLLPEHLTSEIVRTATPQFSIEPTRLLRQLSYSHFELLIGVQNDLQRAFYEIECLKGNWSVRELKRQIASLYYERSGFSTDKDKLSQLANQVAESASPQHVIRDPYVFEFLGLRAKDVLPESDLENALLSKLQDFLLELGAGFCFEARQRRILIGGEHFFVDLVFYHRILKCHVLIELKADEFKHEYLGQLNTYVSWFQTHEMREGDNPPIGILLCTRKNHALVEYALAAMSNQLFVSKYQLELPSTDQMQRFLEAQLQEASQ